MPSSWGYQFTLCVILTFIIIDRQGEQIKLITESMRLHQLVKENTYFSGNLTSLVDLLFVDTFSFIKTVKVGKLICEKHCPIICSLNNTLTEKIVIERNIYDYRCADVQQLNHFVENHFNNVNFNSMSVDDCTSFIQKTLLSGLDKYVPHKKVTVHKKDKIWMTDNIKQKISVRDKLFKTHRRKKCVASWETYKRARNQVTKLIKDAKSEYLIRISKELEDPTKNNKAWHKTVNGILKKSKDSIIPPLKYDNCTAFSNESKSNVLNKFFCNKTKLEGYNDDVKTNISFKTNNHLSDITFSPEIILN